MTFVMYQDSTRQWRWYLQATNGKKLADSGESYHNKADCLSAINSIKMSAASAKVIEK